MISRLVTAMLVLAGALTAACDKPTPITPTAPAAPVTPVAPAPAPTPPASTPQGTVRGSVVSLEGVPLDGIQVRTEFNAATTTDLSGSYALPYPVQTTGLPYSYIVAGNNNFELFRSTFNRDAAEVQLQAVRLQPRFELTDGSLASTISARDLSYWSGDAYDSDYCSPCKRIRLRSDKPRKVSVTLDWSGQVPLQVWVWSGSPSETELPYNEGLGHVVAGKAENGATRVTVQVEVFVGDTLIHVGTPYNRTAAPSPTVPFTLSVGPG